jgi:N-sulfoglucosamine sulfohydrolase
MNIITLMFYIRLHSINYLLYLTLIAVSGVLMYADRPNVVVFTVDDMDITSVNCYGNPLANLTPNMDKLAKQGLRFEHAYVNTPICMPCRQSMMTGLHPHSNGSLGFTEVDSDRYPSLSGILMDNGYYTASISKGRDYKAFPWDYFVSGLGAKGWYSRKPEAFYDEAKKSILAAKNAGKPFYIGVNTSDPHRPFAGSLQEKEHVLKLRKKYPQILDYPKVEPICSEKEVPLLPYLPDLPDIRKEMVQYLTCVKRADNTLGKIIQLLDEEGLYANTIFIFFSDHGAPMPSAKQNVYAHSAQTPLMIRWPSKIAAGSVDNKHMLSTVDLMATILEAVGIPVPNRQDGRSFLPILKGEDQDDREAVFVNYNYYLPGMQVFPMRAVHTKEWSYIFNAWANGINKRVGTENQSGLTFPAIRNAARTDPLIKRRLDEILLRSKEELFDRRKDPYALNNVVENPEAYGALNKLKNLVTAEMRRSRDPLLEYFEGSEGYPEEWDN